MLARVLACVAAMLLLAGAAPAHAHPMGNFSVNHYSKLTLDADHVTVQYFIDLAEIPAYQELQAGGIQALPHDAAVLRFIATRGRELGHGLTLNIDGTTVPLHLRSSDVLFPPGAGGLPTMKMGFLYEAEYPAGIDRQHVAVQYADDNFAGHSGWKEIIAVDPGGRLLRSSVPASDRSAGLSNYPTDLLTSPPQDLQATLVAALPAQKATDSALGHKDTTAATASTAPTRVTAKPATPAAGAPSSPVSRKQSVQTGAVPQSSPAVTTQAAPPLRLRANQQQTPRSRFTELITEQHLSLWFLFTAALIAVGLGGLHALEPGHGKTVVAAYLVGSRGTARHAALLGLIVTASHTASVFALGAITLYASHYIVPEQLYPWLGVVSGLIIAGLGGYMLLRRLTGTATDHSHADGEGHWPFRKTALPAASAASAETSAAPRPKQIGTAQLLTLGITGGIVPCPAALVVLLSAFALHRVALGFFLIVAFSVGLAAVLIGFGLLMVYSRRFMSRFQVEGPWIKRWLPILSSAFITVLGGVLVYQALPALHLSTHLFTKEHLGPVLFVTGLGLLLGMRHSTDPDHVVAISTIVSKQRGIGNAALIGSVWGLGHTITIFIVGALIILFDVKIPPRLGLSMEFSVAIMLIVLGLLNLTGIMQKVTAYFTPAQALTKAALAVDARQHRRVPKLLRSPVDRVGVYQFFRPLAIGLVHGLAGSAAVALLVLATIHNPMWATLYLLIFGAGTMIGMMCMTAAIAVPLTYAGKRFDKLSRFFGVASGLVSVSFGSFLVYQLGYLGGLFTSHPEWTPR